MMEVFEEDVRKFQCDICYKTFRRRDGLKKHKKIHTGERNFKCDICGKAFIEKGKLSIHQNVHNNVKNFSCDFCEKSFNQKHYLNVHLRIHTGEKPYKCTMCEKAFARKDHLNKHINAHTGLKPYSCDKCGKSFGGYANCYRHKKNCKANGNAQAKEVPEKTVIESQDEENVDGIKDYFDGSEDLDEDSNYELNGQEETIVEDVETEENSVYDSDYVVISQNDINKYCLVANFI